MCLFACADIQLAQFLLSKDGKLKLNDFNRAEIMLFNEKDNEYCKYRNNPGHGDVSSVRFVAIPTCTRLNSCSLLNKIRQFCAFRSSSGERPKSTTTNLWMSKSTYSVLGTM